MIDGIGQGFGELLQAGVVLFAFKASQILTRGVPKWKGCLAVLAGIAFLSWAAGANYGTHVEDADPLFGGGERVMDFEAAAAEKVVAGWKLFVMLAVPAGLGIFIAREESV